jgi:hypothetical protein
MSSGERELVSSATLDGLCCELFVERDPLLALIQRHGALDVQPASDGAPRLLPVVCELWHVTDGRSLLGGFDPQRVFEQCAGVAGAFLGPRAEVVRILNRLFSLGPYHECLVAVPNVLLEPRGQRHALVLAMITDNPIALSIDRSFGYGYRKRLGRFDFQDRRRFAVSVERELVVLGELAEDEAALAEPERAWLDDYWAQPLLGRLGPHDFRRSWLERRLSAAEARASRIGSSVALSPELGLGGERVQGRAVSFSRVPTRISLPRRLSSA